MIVLILGGAIQGILLGFFLIIFRKGHYIANRLLGVLLLIFSYISFINVLLFTKYLLNLPHFAFTQSALAFLIAPVYYFYLKIILHKKVVFKSTNLLHLLPFLAFLILTFSFFEKSTSDKLEILTSIYNSNVSLRNVPFNKNVFYSGLFIQFLFYSYNIYKILFSSKFKLKKPLPSIVKALLTFWVIIMVLAISRILFFYELKSSIFLPVFLAFGMYTLAYWSLSKQGYFHQNIERPNKYKKATVSKDKIKTLSEQLMTILEHDRLYLDPDLTATKIAEKISVSTHILSQVINEELDDTFYNLINRLRVNDAKKKLLNNSFSHLSIEGIGNESGFKSKSSFYRAFKKFTGQTPSEFKNLK